MQQSNNDTNNNMNNQNNEITEEMLQHVESSYSRLNDFKKTMANIKYQMQNIRKLNKFEIKKSSRIEEIQKEIKVCKETIKMQEYQLIQPVPAIDLKLKDTKAKRNELKNEYQMLYKERVQTIKKPKIEKQDEQFMKIFTEQLDQIKRSLRMIGIINDKTSNLSNSYGNPPPDFEEYQYELESYKKQKQTQEKLQSEIRILEEQISILEKEYSEKKRSKSEVPY